MVELTAVGKRSSDGVEVISESKRIPYLGQWVRDYVDNRSVSDGMVVLKAEVNIDETDVESLVINELCASEREQRESERVDTINLSSF